MADTIGYEPIDPSKEFDRDTFLAEANNVRKIGMLERTLTQDSHNTNVLDDTASFLWGNPNHYRELAGRGESVATSARTDLAEHMKGGDKNLSLYAAKNSNYLYGLLDTQSKLALLQNIVPKKADDSEDNKEYNSFVKAAAQRQMLIQAEGNDALRNQVVEQHLAGSVKYEIFMKAGASGILAEQIYSDLRAMADTKLMKFFMDDKGKLNEDKVNQYAENATGLAINSDEPEKSDAMFVGALIEIARQRLKPKEEPKTA